MKLPSEQLQNMRQELLTLEDQELAEALAVVVAIMCDLERKRSRKLTGIDRSKLIFQETNTLIRQGRGGGGTNYSGAGAIRPKFL